MADCSSRSGWSGIWPFVSAASITSSAGGASAAGADGGIYDGDLALRAVASALDDASIHAEDVDVFVHITSTPDTVTCQDHFRYLTHELGLRRDVDLIHHNLGCAGLAPGFRTAAASLGCAVPSTAVVVASNCPSGYFGPDVHDYYYSTPEDNMGWLAPLMFADGAGAVLTVGTT